MVDQQSLEILTEMALTSVMIGVIAGTVTLGHWYVLRSRVRDYGASGIAQQLTPTAEPARTIQRSTGPRATDDPQIREEGDNIVEFTQVGDDSFRQYGDQQTTVRINCSIGKGLTVDDYVAAVAYLDKRAQRIHPHEEPHWPHFHERAYLLHGVAVTVPEPLGMLRVQGYSPAVKPVVEQLMANLPFLKRPREVQVK
ncbi:MAG: hypothetical protein Q7R76_00210 [Candidatus Woesearchaeota archaeon]|nr:hypothetical protein [Candidatus Woesearchaeota archaeon]